MELDTELHDKIEAQLNFLINVFQTIKASEANPEVIYPLLQDNLAHLNEDLMPMITYTLTDFGESEEEARQICAAVIFYFANLIQEFPLGSRLINLEIAIYCYQLTLEEVFTRDAFPEQWAMTRMNLANAYSKRIWGERADNLEESIQLDQLTLKEVYTRDAFPVEWAETQVNLATSYSSRIRGDKAANLEESIKRYQLALEVFTREAFPVKWATTQHNMGMTYRVRIQGERAANLEESIQCYRLALEVRTREAYPEQWAMTQMNLASAYANRIRGDKAANLEESIQCYRLALEVRNREAYPEQWAMTQINLAGAYTNRIREDRAANLEESIACLQSALDVYKRDAYPEMWAVTQHNLAVAYEEIERVSEAITCYRSALEIRTPLLLPLDCLITSRGFGNLAFKQGDWALAIEAYDLAIQAVETSRSWAMSDDSRQEILRDAIHVYENAIQASINLNRLDLAIQYSERARSRQLVDFMMTKDLHADAEIPTDVAQYWAEYNNLDAQIHHFQQPDADSPQNDRQPALTRKRAAFDAANKEIATLETQKQAIWQQIRARDPVVAQQLQVTPIDLNVIQGLITNDKTAILSFYTTDEHTHIFMLTHQNKPQLHTLTGQGMENLQLWLRQQWSNPYAYKQLTQELQKLQAQIDRETNPERLAELEPTLRQLTDLMAKLGMSTDGSWQDLMPQTLEQLANRLELDNLIAKLPKIEELIIVPHLFLHQISFAALPLGDGYLGDKFTIRHVPSCRVLKFCTDRRQVENPKNGTVENVDRSLPGSDFECEKIANLFTIDRRLRLQGKTEATISNFLNLLQQEEVTNCTISTHAQSRLDNPLESGVQLADGNFKLGRLMLIRFPDLHEVFLSCCETHLGTTKITDDVLTLATGFLCAGARTVIGSLWAVEDLATALFSIFYYHNRYDGIDRAKALKQAQVRLRNLTGEEFGINHAPELRKHLTEYAQKIRAERKEIDPSNPEYERLLGIYNNTMTLRSRLDELSKCDRPFDHPYYWAAFTCQGLT
jgi:CHAT domain-containing protein